MRPVVVSATTVRHILRQDQLGQAGKRKGVPAENSIGLLPNRRSRRCLNGRRDDHVALWAVNRNL
jgi:hypothetical protein